MKFHGYIVLQALQQLALTPLLKKLSGLKQWRVTAAKVQELSGSGCSSWGNDVCRCAKRNLLLFVALLITIEGEKERAYFAYALPKICGQWLEVLGHVDIQSQVVAGVDGFRVSDSIPATNIIDTDSIAAGNLREIITAADGVVDFTDNAGIVR